MFRSLLPGMVLQFNCIDFRNKDGVLEKAVEAWCRLKEGGRPPSPSALVSSTRCKVGWLERDVAVRIGPKLDGKCACVHKLLRCGTTGERRLSHRKNGSAEVYLIAKIPDAAVETRAPKAAASAEKKRKC